MCSTHHLPPLLHCREGVTCDDSCEFAFDGTCDDGSEGDYEEYYEQYGYYRDDDLGGYAGGDGTEGERAAAGGTYEEVCTPLPFRVGTTYTLYCSAFLI